MLSVMPSPMYSSHQKAELSNKRAESQYVFHAPPFGRGIFIRKEGQKLASLYKVSTDTSEKEKAVGGIMTFGQAGWLALGLLIFGALFLLLSKALPPLFALIISLPPGAVFGCMFAFYKKEQLSLFSYLFYKHSFKKKTKLLINDMNYGKVFLPEDNLF